jgi:hypothetical protein
MMGAMNQLICPASVQCDDKSNQRTFSQTPAVVEKAIRSLQSSASGPLPTLDGFAAPGDVALDQFKRGYYQCVAKVVATPAGGSEVRVTARITAWYASSNPANAGYKTLPSNGRLESDFLDHLSEVLASKANAAPLNADVSRSTAKKVDSNEPTISAPMPQSSNAGTVFRRLETNKLPAKAPGDKQNQDLAQEAKGLEEILRNQSHPTNLAAVKEPGTPVLVSPNLGAKVMFQAAAEDEFEVLDMNANWVHVRISGLSRGWIRRSSLELPDTDATTTEAAVAPVATAPSTSEPPFQIENEEIASFPSNWEPLRGKTVKIVSLQQHGSAGQTGAPAKLAFAKTLLDKEYTDLKRSASAAAGVVLIFDSADGGMMAATMPVLQQWKAGALSDEALWRRCFFDPPELSGSLQP